MSDEQNAQNDGAVHKPEAQAPEAPKVAEASPLADAVRALITFVKAHRTAGDSDLEAAIADVESALASWGT